MYSCEELARDFRRLGVTPGMTVMLHASLRGVGQIAGGPDQIHLALKRALTESGTLVMYASCPDHVDEVGRVSLPADVERELVEKLPAFDASTARAARDNGVLVEFFRTWPGSRVNPHPARFVVWGRSAAALMELQPWNYAYGRGSLLERFLALDGRILLLGSSHDAVTFLHYAEHIVDVPGKRVVRFKVPVEENGRRVWRDMEEFDTAEPCHPRWPVNLFEQLVDGYLGASGNTGGRVGDAESFLFSARELLEYSLPIMTTLAMGGAVEGAQAAPASRAGVGGERNS